MAAAPDLSNESLFDRCKAIDVDTHITEPPDVWTSRVSSKWGDLVPHVVNHEGRALWMIGDQTAGLSERMDLWELRYVVVNAAAMLWAVVGISMLFSAAGSRRGRAVGAIFALLVASFLLNSLVAFWPRAETLAVLGLLHYFRPFAIVRDGCFQITDIAVLLSVAIITWVAGGFIFSRRDIHTA